MHSTEPPPETLTKVRPAQYLTPSFKAYILEYILLSLIRKSTLPSLSKIKEVEKSQRNVKSHKNRPKKVRMRTEEEELPFEFSSNTYQYLSNSFHQLTPKHQSPFRPRDTSKNYKTQYHSNGYSIGLPLTNQERTYGSGQRIIPDYFHQTDAQFVSPYRKKDNVSIVQANYSTQRCKKVQSPLSKDDSDDRSNAKDSKSSKMREKLKSCAARLIITTLKYACNRLQRSLYRSIQHIYLIKLKTITAQKKETTSRLIRELQNKDILLKEQRNTVQKYARDILFYQKWSIFIKMEALLKLSLRNSFQSLKQSERDKVVTIKQSSDDEQQQYTIIYTNDEEINGHHGEIEGIHLNISTDWDSGDKIQDSHRSRATNSSGQNE